MRPTDLEDYLSQDPFKPVRLKLSSGDQVIIENPRRALVSGMSLALAVPADRSPLGQTRLKLISIPNITRVEPLDPGSRRNGRRRR